METLKSTEFYDRLAKAFDVMTDWPKRLAFEMPFLLRTLGEHQAQSLLDAACGTGGHAIALARKGYRVTGCDASPGMIELARANAARAGVAVRFEVADFNGLEALAEKFDAAICLGNSLPHLLSQQELTGALRGIRGRLGAGGAAILHNLNYDMRMKKKPRFFSAEGNEDTLVWRFADYGPEFITFHTALFERTQSQERSSWSAGVNSTLQRPLLYQDLVKALTEAGFGPGQCFGGLDGSAFDPGKSADLVIVADAG